MFVLIAGYDIN